MLNPVTPARQTLVPVILSLPARAVLQVVLPVYPVKLISIKSTAVKTVIRHREIPASVPKLVKILPPCRLMLLPLNQVVLPAALPRLLLPALIVMTVMLNPAALVSPNLVKAFRSLPARQEPQVVLPANPVLLPNIKSTAVRAVILKLIILVEKHMPTAKLPDTLLMIQTVTAPAQQQFI